MDAKASIPIGWFSRGGQTRVMTKALDHDFGASAKLTPYGIFLPEQDELYLYFSTSRITSDFIVDCLTDCWQHIQQRFPHITTLLINQDNGGENHSHRTQFMQRITTFADHFQLTIQLAYYPPYHSKYNPIERVWGILEQHWNGSILDSIQTVLRFANTLTWKGLKPKQVQLNQAHYPKGMKHAAPFMKRLEQRFERLRGLENWFVRIVPIPI